MKRIVTHPGKAHRDEFMACCLLLTQGGFIGIARRPVLDQDLTSPDIYVVDQGGQYDLELKNFDHHQLPPEAPATCSISLVLPELGIDRGLAVRVWQWLEFSEVIDSRGPQRAAGWLGISQGTLWRIHSPIEVSVLRWFESMNDIRLGSALYDLMYRIGQDKLDYLAGMSDRLLRLSTEGKFRPIADGWTAFDVRGIHWSEDPVMGMHMYLENVGAPKCAVTISNCTRDRGMLALYRRDEGYPFDFTRVAGQPGVLFTHPNGFLTKVDPRVADLDFILKGALIPAEQLKLCRIQQLDKSSKTPGDSKCE